MEIINHPTDQLSLVHLRASPRTSLTQCNLKGSHKIDSIAEERLEMWSIGMSALLDYLKKEEKREAGCEQVRTTHQ